MALNIDWRRIDWEDISYESWNQQIKKLASLGYTCETVVKSGNVPQKITAIHKLRRKYFVQAIRNTHQTALFFFDHEICMFRKLRFKLSANVSKTDVIQTQNGTIAYRTMTREFKKNNKDVENFTLAMNGKNGKYRRDIKNCCPAPITYCDTINGRFFSTENNFFKADVSSAYAFEATKSLPDLANCVVKSGRHAPTKEYPFAFEIKSRHVSILEDGKLISTRKCLESKFYNPSEMVDGVVRYPEVDAKDETTILMPISKYSLKKEMETFYDMRKTDPNAKMTLNAFLGYLQCNTSPKCPQIAAVILLRCIARQIDIAEKVEFINNGNRVKIINTDSVAWVGSTVPEIIDSEKKLGANLIEYENASAIIMGVKKYQIKSNDEVKTVIAGVSKDITEKMKYTEILNVQKYSDHLQEYIVHDDGSLTRRKAIII